MKRGPSIALALGASLATWASVYLFVPLSPAVEQVVEAVRLPIFDTVRQE